MINDPLSERGRELRAWLGRPAAVAGRGRVVWVINSRHIGRRQARPMSRSRRTPLATFSPLHHFSSVWRSEVEVTIGDFLGIIAFLAIMSLTLFLGLRYAAIKAARAAGNNGKAR